VVVVARIGAAQITDDKLIFPVQTENEALIQRYEIEFVDENGIVQVRLTYVTPPYDEVQVPLEELEGGNYTVVLRAIGGDGRPIADESSVRMVYDIPPTATPAPTITPTPSPSITSIEGLRNNLNIVIPVVVVLIGALLLLLVALARRPKHQTGTGFLAEMTGAQEARDQLPVYTPSTEAPDPDKTNAMLQLDPDATSPVPHLLLPPTVLIVVRSRDTGIVGQEITIPHVPFKIGRKNDNDFIVAGDDNVSRYHAEITFDNGIFSIADLGSQHGTVVNGQRLAVRTPVPISSGSQIVIGTTTILTFETEETFDPNATGPRGIPE
jgi:hypothetical protein